MPIVCYRKSDLTIVGTVDDSMTPQQELELNVIPNFDGNIEDYDFIETDKLYFHLELIDGEVVVIKDEPPVAETSPTLEEQLAEKDKEITLLKAQNKALTDRTDFHEDLIVELAMEVYK